MEEKPLTNAELQKATSRRSRKDQEGRDFQCGCGKRYLSYPALYTHIKTKHDGKQPEGTQKSGIASSISKRVKGKIEEQTWKGIHSLIQKEDFMILNELEQGHLGSVPLNSRIKKQNIPKQIYECYLNIIKQQECKLNSNSSLELALCVYLLNAGEYVIDKIYDYYLHFARLARNCYYNHGEQIYRVCFSKKQGGISYLPKFCQGEVRHFPIIGSFLITHFIPETEPARERDMITSMVQLILSDFCAWLYRKKLSQVKITLIKEYKLDVKPAVPLLKNKSIAKKDDLKQKQLRPQSSNSQQIKKDDQEESQQASELQELEEQEGEDGDKLDQLQN